MTKKEISEKITGIEYPCNIHPDILQIASENGLVIVYGMSDDLLEFNGALDEEFGAWEGQTVYINKDGFVEKGQISESKVSTIKAVWCPKDIDCSWLIKTDIHHETFDIMEDGELFCRGIVFDMGDLG